MFKVQSLKLNIPALAAASVLLAASVAPASAQSATNNPPSTSSPTTPADFFSGLGSYFTSVNTNLTWTNTPASLWTGVNYQAGVNTSAELGASYDLWKPSPAFALAPEGIVRNAGVAGTVVSGQAGAGISLFHYDLKVTGYLDGGYNSPLNSGFVEFGARLEKKMTVSTHAGIGLAWQKLFHGPAQNTPTVTAHLGWDF
jgi:hypothetical protein